MSSVDGALRAAAAVGPYFSWEPWTSGDGWRPLTDLSDLDVVAERVDAARQALVGMFGLAEDAVPLRVVASVTFLGVASRLLSPPLGALVLGGTLPTPGPDRLWWKPVAGGPWPIAYGSVAGVPGDGATLVATTVNGLVAPVLHAFQERFVLSPQVLWGNVASALAGAAGMLADTQPHDRVTGLDDCAAIGQPGVGGRAGDVVAQALTVPPLVGTGTLIQPDPARARRFLVRHNCCLYYRIPGAGTCGDCVLTPSADRRRDWQSVLATHPR